MAKIHSFVVVQNKRHDVKVMFAEALDSHKAMTNNKTAVLWMLGMHWQTGAHDESRYLDKCQLHAKPLIKQGIVVFFASCMHASCCLLLMQNASFFYLLCLHRQLGRLAMCSCAVVQLCSCAHKQSLCRHICTLGTTLDQQPKWDIQTIVDPLNENCVWRMHMQYAQMKQSKWWSATVFNRATEMHMQQPFCRVCCGFLVFQIHQMHNAYAYIVCCCV